MNSSLTKKSSDSPPTRRYTDRVRAEAILTKWDGRADTWQRLSCNGRQLPEPRSGHSVERIGDACFVFGGYNEGHCMANLYRFDLRRYEWEALRPEGAGPEGRASHASCAIETVGGHGYYYVHGGSGAEWGRSSKNDLFCYHTKRRRWLQVKQSGRLPPPMYGHSLALHRENTLILFGGTTGWDYFNDVYAFDVPSKTWRTLRVKGAPPSMRYKHQSCIIKDGLYILGGGQFHAPDYPFDVHRLDLVTLTWEQIVAPNAPTGRLAHACTVASGHPSQFQFRRHELDEPRSTSGGKAHAGMKRVRPASGSGRIRIGTTSIEGGEPSSSRSSSGNTRTGDNGVELAGTPPRRTSTAPSSMSSRRGSNDHGQDWSAKAARQRARTDEFEDTVLESASDSCDMDEETVDRDAHDASDDLEGGGESDFILVFGGKDNRDRKLNDMYSFDVNARIWRCMSGPKPTKPGRLVSGAHGPAGAGSPEPPRMEARDFHCMEVVRNRVFIFGGCAGEERLNDVWRYTMRQGPPSLQLLCVKFIRQQVELNDQWALLKNMPENLRRCVLNLNPQSEVLEYTASEVAMEDRMDLFDEPLSQHDSAASRKKNRREEPSEIFLAPRFEPPSIQVNT